MATTELVNMIQDVSFFQKHFQSQLRALRGVESALSASSTWWAATLSAHLLVWAAGYEWDGARWGWWAGGQAGASWHGSQPHSRIKLATAWITTTPTTDTATSAAVTIKNTERLQTKHMQQQKA